MVNLLTKKTLHALYRMYFMRLAATAVWVMGLAALVVAILLVPSYLVIHAEADQASSYVKVATDIANQRTKSESTETLSSFKEKVAFLNANNRPPRTAKILSVLTADVPRGISIDKIDITLEDAKQGTLTIEGIAATRAILVAYRDQLKKEGEFASVTIPVADLVADVNSGFSMVLTYTTPK